MNFFLWESRGIVEDRRQGTRGGKGERRTEDAARIADALKRRGRISLRVHGTSMQPWVQPGDIALVRQASLENVRCGDVVLFRRENHLLVHRIVEKRGSLEAAEFFAKGDAHPDSDGRVQEKELLGRVVRLYRGQKRIDLEAPGHLALGLLISQFSLRSRVWYPVARFLAAVTRPVRRVLQSLRIAKSAVR
jgi:hypothetical protein